MNMQTTIKTERLLLRPFVISDAIRVQTLASVKEVAVTTANIPHPYPNELAEQWISQHLDKWNAGILCSYAITLSKSNSLIGAISLMNIKNHHAELGYWLGIDYWKHGYCTEACKAIVAYGFNDLSLTQINAHHLSSNPASGRVLIKSGFTSQGSDTIYWPKTQNTEKIERYFALSCKHHASSEIQQ